MYGLIKEKYLMEYTCFAEKRIEYDRKRDRLMSEALVLINQSIN